MKPTYTKNRTTARPQSAPARRRLLQAALGISGAILFVEVVGQVLTASTSGLVLAAILLVVAAAILVLALPLLAHVPERAPRQVMVVTDPRQVRQLQSR